MGGADGRADGTDGSKLFSLHPLFAVPFLSFFPCNSTAVASPPPRRCCCTHISQIRPIMQSGAFSPPGAPLPERDRAHFSITKIPVDHSFVFKEPKSPTDVHSDPSAAIGAAAAVAPVWKSILRRRRRRSLLHARLHVV